MLDRFGPKFMYCEYIIFSFNTKEIGLQSEILSFQCNLDHTFLLYFDTNGDALYARGGPSAGMYEAPFTGWGDLQTSWGKYLPGTPDWPTGRNFASQLAQSEAWPKISVDSGADLSAQWNNII